MIAREIEDLSICDKIITQEIKCSCYKRKALALNDPSSCEQCNNDGVRTSDYADCYYDIAQDRQDPSICGMVRKPEGKCLCYWRVAEDLKDPVFCEQCRDYADWRTTNYEECLSDVAGAKGDPSLCGMIQNQETKDSCYYWVAERKKDASICTAIAHQLTKNKCERSASEE